MKYDAIIIGAGVVGGAIARELSRYNLSVLALEKERDVCCGISKSNTGIVHTPCLVKGPSRKAELNLKGNRLFPRLCEEMEVTLQWPGALILAYSEEDREALKAYKKQGEETRRLWNTPPENYRIIEKEELCSMEPHISEKVQSALFAPDTGRVIPYELGIALWENARKNGVELRLQTPVDAIIRPAEKDNLWTVKSGDEIFQSSFLINAAGHGSTLLGKIAGMKPYKIDKVKGQYLIYNREKSFDVNHILFQVPEKGHGKEGKGILVCQTVYGNLMIGPDARWIDDPGDNGTDRETLREVLEGARKSIPVLEEKDVIKTFAGIRPKPVMGDFVIEAHNGFIHLCGIESPGLTSSPAIAAEVMELLKNEGLELNPKTTFTASRKPIVKQILHLEKNELKRRINLDDMDDEKIICRCEQVPRKRIIDAMNRGIKLDTLDAVKRRTRAGQGRCQGAFCGSRVQKLLSRELGISEEEITQRGDEPLGERVKKL